MPTHKVKGGYKWGSVGKTYPTKKQADKQGQAIYANGWKENKNENINKIMANNKVIRLTEADLKEIIKESVNMILSEGQGWDTFKYLSSPSVDDYGKMYKDGEFRKQLKGFAKDKDTRDFIKYGGGDKQLGYYDPEEPYGTETYHDGYKPVNKSAMGKVGRAAGVTAGVGAAIAKRGAAKVKNAIKNRNKKEDPNGSFTM